MSRELILLTTTASTDEAMLLKGFLVEDGIAAQVVNDVLPIGTLPIPSKAAPQVMVPSDTIDQARKINAWFQERRRSASKGSCCSSGQCHDNQEPISEQVVEAMLSEEKIEFDWPVCPQCDQKRQAVCDICATAGTDFPLADFQGITAPTGKVSGDEKKQGQANPLLMCPHCEEAFAPRYYRICAWCKHDFKSGVEIKEPSLQEVEPINHRLRSIIILLVLASAALLGYFWYIGTIR